MSILTRSWATAKLCSTSLERSSSFTGLPSGTCSSGLDSSTSSRPLGSAGFIPKGLASLTKRECTVPSLPSLPGSR